MNKTAKSCHDFKKQYFAVIRTIDRNEFIDCEAAIKICKICNGQSIAIHKVLKKYKTFSRNQIKEIQKNGFIELNRIP